MLRHKRLALAAGGIFLLAGLGVFLYPFGGVTPPGPPTPDPNPAPAPLPRDLAPQEGGIRGRVIIPEGVEPGAAVEVSLHRFQPQGSPEQLAKVLATANGSFLFVPVKPGRGYWVLAKVPGHATAATDAIEVESKRVTELGVIAIPEGHALWIDVVDTAGQVVPRADLLLSRVVRTGRRTASATEEAAGSTDGRGRHCFRNLAPGRYHLRVNRPDYAGRTLLDVHVPIEGNRESLEVVLRPRSP